MADIWCYFIRESEATITAETFDMVVQFAMEGGDHAKNMLEFSNCLITPLVPLMNFMDKNSKDHYLQEMHCFLNFLTGEYLKGKEREVQITVKGTVL